MAWPTPAGAYTVPLFGMVVFTRIFFWLGLGLFHGATEVGSDRFVSFSEI